MDSLKSIFFVFVLFLTTISCMKEKNVKATDAIVVTQVDDSASTDEQDQSDAETSANENSVTISEAAQKGLNSIQVALDNSTQKITASYEFLECESCFDEVSLVRTNKNNEQQTIASSSDTSSTSLQASIVLDDLIDAQYKLKICIDSSCFESEDAVGLALT